MTLLIGGISIDLGVFKNIKSIEKYCQIFIGILFVILAIFALPIDVKKLSLEGSIPLTYWIAVIFIGLLPIYSGVIRWIMRIFGIIGEQAEEELRKEIS